MPEQHDEDEAARLNRNFDDLLQELRVSQNGTQILFAFLLTVPFSNGFRNTTDFQRDLFFATLLVAALSSAMLIAPAVMHRVLFRQHMKAELVKTAGMVALGGQALLTLAVTGSVLLVGDYIYSLVVGITLAVVTCLWWVGWFFVMPLWLRAVHRRRARTSST
jgi:SNF family Na+-dependent transporter